MPAGRKWIRARHGAWARAAPISFALFTFVASPLQAATRIHALVIGNNGPFPAKSDASTSSLPPLHYADDDAAAFHELIVPVAHTTELLTVMDGETQALYPDSVRVARVPTLAAVKAAVGRIGRNLAEERKKGHRNVVFVFFSGHGSLTYENQPALALFDGGLARDFLYEEVLAKLPADELHLLVDACHAEAVVRPREQQAEVVSVSADRAKAFLVETTLARFPHVGAIVAATTDAKAHEWDAIRHGIFTHELLSALRGGADVNRDRRVEYSEAYAFMTAANREVADVRARLSIAAKPPDTNRRAPLLDLGEFPRERVAWLRNVSGRHGLVELSDGRGRRVLTLHADRELVTDLLLPVRGTLYIRGGSKEASFDATAGHVIAFDRLTFVGQRTHARDGLDDAMRRGLFAAPYGRRYYDGVVDQMPIFLPVDFSEANRADETASEDERSGSRAGYGIMLGGGLSSGVANILPVIQGMNLGLRPMGGDGAAASLAVLGARDGPLTEWHYMASAGWLWSVGKGPLRGFGGGALGGGLFRQVVDDSGELRSAAISAAPMLGFSVDLGGGFATWSEVEVSAVLYALDGRTTISLFPAAWLGAAFRL